VAEALARIAMLLVVLQDRDEYRYDVGHRHQVSKHKVQPPAQNLAADENRVLVPAATDHANVALIRPSAAVWASGHPHAQLLILQAEALQLGLEPVEDPWQHALGFRER